MGKLLNNIKNFFRQKRVTHKECGEHRAAQQGIRPYNPHIAYMRHVLEQVLIERNLSYQNLRLAVEDVDMQMRQEGADETNDTSLVSDDIMDTLYQLSRGLNHLLLITDRPEYFADYVEMMYEEYGLVTEIQPRSHPIFTEVNVVLDFSYEGRSVSGQDAEDYLYIPIYRRPWKMAGNLDIMVPIGYNIVIVERSVDDKTKEPLDKFEREFYA